MIVLLKYASNICYTHCVDPSMDKDVKVHKKKKVWTFEDVVYDFGEVRHCSHGAKYGPITVKDVTTPADIDNLIHLAKEATDTPMGPLED